MSFRLYMLTHNNICVYYSATHNINIIREGMLLYEIGKRIRGKKIICEISKAISTFISDNQIG